MKKLITYSLITVSIFVLGGCGEEDTKKEPVVVLSEYEQGYKFGESLYTIDKEFIKVVNELKSLKKHQELNKGKVDADNVITSASFAYLSGKISAMCQAAAFGDYYNENKIEYSRGIQNGCIDKYNSLLR